MFFLHRGPAQLKMTHVNMIISSSLIFHPIPMKFWLKTTNIIYMNWLNSHIDKIIFKISRYKNRHGTVKVPHPVYALKFGIYMYRVRLLNCNMSIFMSGDLKHYSINMGI